MQLKGGKPASWTQQSHSKLTLLIHMALLCKIHVCSHFKGIRGYNMEVSWPQDFTPPWIHAFAM